MANDFNWQTQVLDAGVQYFRDDGTPGRVDGPPSWASSDSRVEIHTSDDGFSAVVSALDNVTATITVVADGDLGSGTQTITLSAEVNASDVDIEATGGQIVFTPRAKN